jgi:hypothetical protein
MSYPLKSVDLVFFDDVLGVLSENKANRRGTGEEGKRRFGLSRSRRDKHLYG